MTTEERKIQKVLNKLMSEEMLAHMFYMGCTVATKKETSNVFIKMFVEIAEDELNDHFMHLKNWAVANDFDIPFKMKDYVKYAEKCTKQLDSLKTDQSLEYYVEQAIISEVDAINSYEEVMKIEELPYELNTIIMQNYYDELEHMDKLNILKYALESGADLINY